MLLRGPERCEPCCRAELAIATPLTITLALAAPSTLTVMTSRADTTALMAVYQHVSGVCLAFSIGGPTFAIPIRIGARWLRWRRCRRWRPWRRRLRGLRQERTNRSNESVLEG